MKRLQASGFAGFILLASLIPHMDLADTVKVSIAIIIMSVFASVAVNGGE